jgi:hypothetical protein
MQSEKPWDKSWCMNMLELSACPLSFLGILLRLAFSPNSIFCGHLAKMAVLPNSLNMDYLL